LSCSAPRSRVGERDSAEIPLVMATYFGARDEFGPVSCDELLDRLRCGAVEEHFEVVFIITDAFKTSVLTARLQ
jgi:hypothetical protein